eukprot:2655050-Rhodomonas_salina.1
MLLCHAPTLCSSARTVQCPVLSCAMLLRASYAVSGTVLRCMFLRTCYAVCGTEEGHAAISYGRGRERGGSGGSASVSCRSERGRGRGRGREGGKTVRYAPTLLSYALCRTTIARTAMRCPVLRWRMLLQEGERGGAGYNATLALLSVRYSPRVWCYACPTPRPVLSSGMLLPAGERWLALVEEEEVRSYAIIVRQCCMLLCRTARVLWGVLYCDRA